MRSPELITRLLRRLALRSSFADGMLGDLEQLRSVEISRLGGLRAAVRHWRRLISAILHLARARFRYALERRGAQAPWEAARQDVSYAARSLVNTPALSVTALLTLTVGIGVTTATWSVIDRLLLQVPVAEPDRVVQIMETRGGFGVGNNAPRNLQDWKEKATTLERVAAFYSDQRFPVILEKDTAREIAPALFASSDLLPILGVQPILGRGFSPEEDELGTDPVAIISHAFWVAEFGAEPDVLGRTIRLATMNNPELPEEMQPTGYEPGYPTRDFTIVGVLPRGFELPPLAWGSGSAYREEGRSTLLSSGLFVARPDILVPWGLYTVFRDRRGFPQVRSLARLAEGVTLEQAQAELDVLAAEVEPEVLGPSMGEYSFGVVLTKVDDLQRQVYGSSLAVLTVGALLILLTACANVAILLVARGESRERECALRACLGAGRLRLIRQLLTEAGLLAVAGGIGGVLLASGGTMVLEAASPTPLGFGEATPVNGRLLAGAVALTVGALLMAGVAPAFLGARADLHRVVSSGYTTASGKRRGWLRWISATQLALSTVLVLGAALLLQSFARIVALDPGFNPARVLTVRLELLPRDVTAYPSFAQGIALGDDIVESLKALPGVDAVVGAAGPLGGPPGWAVDYSAAGPDGAPDTAIPDVRRQVVSPGFFELLDIPLIAGRTINADDVAALRGQVVRVVINEKMSRFFGGPDQAIGRRIRWGPPGTRQPPQTIIGVVGDVRLPEVDGEIGHQVYNPSPGGFVGQPVATTLFIKTAGDPAARIDAIEQAIRAIGPSEPRIVDVATLETILHNALAPRRYQLLLAGLLAGAAVALALIGLFGVMTHKVARQTREIGVRVALGAHGRKVLGETLAEALRLALVGVALGLPAAWALGRLIEAELFDVTPLDPGTNLLACLVMLAASLIAAYLPARRAAGMNPVDTLRQE